MERRSRNTLIIIYHYVEVGMVYSFLVTVSDDTFLFDY